MKRLRWRAVHRAWARLGGYFWLPCPICGQPFGGHERSGLTAYRSDDGRSSMRWRHVDPERHDTMHYAAPR